jgi:hypothetical protein
MSTRAGILRPTRRLGRTPTIFSGGTGARRSRLVAIIGDNFEIETYKVVSAIFNGVIFDALSGHALFGDYSA